MTIVYWAAGWLGGIWLGSFLALPTPLWVALGVLGVITAVLLRRFSLPPVPAIIVAAVALGAARYNVSIPVIDQSHIAFFNGTEGVAVSGLVVKPPDIRERYQNLTVETDSILLKNGGIRPIRGKMLIRAARSPIIEYGTRIQAAGSLEEPDNAGTFDYRRYLADRGIHSIMLRPSITPVSTRAGNPLMHGLLAVRDLAQQSINHLLPQPQAALLSGILLGDDHALPEDLQEDFKKTGMTHIIAISGFNIALIAGALLNGGRHVVGRRAAAWIALAGVAAYTLFVGADAAVVRAAIMGGLFVIAASLLGRPIFAPALLCGAAFFMTLSNPRILWDIGFQLSFAATLGLMLYVGPWSQGIRRRIEPLLGTETGNAAVRFTSEIVLSTAAALLMTLPLLAYHFGTISLIGPLANLLILPAQPGIMAWGGAATIAGMVSPLLGQPPAWIAWLFLSYTTELVHYLAGVPLASATVSLPPLALAGSYALIIAATWLLRGETDHEVERAGIRLNGRQQRSIVFGILLVAVLAAVWLWQRPDGRLHVSFLDVEQGDAILVQTPDGRKLLVDGGAYPSLLLSRIGEQLPFWDRRIDVIAATHPDIDHVGGLVDLFSRYDVGLVITNGAGGEAGSDYHSFLQAAQHSQTLLKPGIPGEVIELGSDVTVQVLHSGMSPQDHDNNSSLILRLVYEDFSLLLTGDAEEEVERELVSSGQQLQSAVLKAGHHGSQTASSRPFLQAVNPQFVVISVGDDNRFGHPHQETLQRITETGAILLRTDESGTIELVSDGSLIWTILEHNLLGFP